MAEYDAIADAYRASKELPFRRAEQHTLFGLLGEVRGLDILDLACGEGFYSRRMKRAGAASVTGVDLSAGMIELARESERREPLGCRYLVSDAADFEGREVADLVVAMFLLNYAETAERLRRFVRVCHDALRPGGRLVGMNDNIENPPRGTVSWEKYGFTKTCRPDPEEGEPILYRMRNADGTEFGFRNFYLKPETYADAFRQAGFTDFRWRRPTVDPASEDEEFWRDFLVDDPPLAAFSAVRPAG